jgi:putative hemolysin
VNSEYSRTPIYQHSLDHIIGVLHSKDVLRVLAGAAEADLMQMLRPPTFVLEGQPIDDVLTLLRRQGTHLALVLDEYGQVAGLVTIEDLLEELVGEIKDEYDQGDEPPFVKRADGSWLIDGLEAYEKVRDRLGLPDEIEPPRRNYTTLAGFIVSHLGHMPRVGDTIALEGYRFEVVDMDGHRIDKVLVQIPPVDAAQAEAE